METPNWVRMDAVARRLIADVVGEWLEAEVNDWDEMEEIADSIMSILIGREVVEYDPRRSRQGD